MQIEDYFMFLEPSDIRVKGHRIGIETVLDEYLTRQRTPEEIQCLFPIQLQRLLMAKAPLLFIRAAGGLNINQQPP